MPWSVATSSHPSHIHEPEAAHPTECLELRCTPGSYDKNSLSLASATDQGMKNGFCDNVTSKVSPSVVYSPAKPFP